MEEEKDKTTVEEDDTVLDTDTDTDTESDPAQDTEDSPEEKSDPENADGKDSKEEKEDGSEKRRDKKKDKATKRERELEEKLAEANDKYLRLAAEYDNFRKRSAKEREGIYGDAYADALSKLLPMLDNLDRASQYTDPEKLADGVKLILKNVPDALTSLGVEQFGEPGDDFDPAMHSAVMMVEDADCEPNKIVAVLQRGYRRGDKILRYAAVTVAGEA